MFSSLLLPSYNSHICKPLPSWIHFWINLIPRNCNNPPDNPKQLKTTFVGVVLLSVKNQHHTTHYENIWLHYWNHIKYFLLLPFHHLPFLLRWWHFLYFKSLITNMIVNSFSFKAQIFFLIFLCWSKKSFCFHLFQWIMEFYFFKIFNLINRIFNNNKMSEIC